MENGNFEKDLFGGHAFEKKKKGLDLLEKYSKQRLVPFIRIPLEYTVIIAIAVLVLVIISYAIGVEVGKRASVSPAVEEKEVTEIQELAEVIPEEPALPVIAEERLEEDIIATETVEETIAKAEPEETVYVIQLASFKDETAARQEVDMLSRKGISAQFKESGNWYQVFATGYQTIEEAKADRWLLSEEYTDCYIRKVK